MSEQTQGQSAPFGIQGQYIKNLNFTSPDPIRAFMASDDTQPSISVDVQAKAGNLGEKTYEVVLDTKIRAKRGDIELFSIDLSFGSVVVVGDVPSAEIQKILMVDVPYLLFPFTRTIISDATRDGGFPPLFLIPIDFRSLFEAQQRAEKKAS